MVQLHWNMIMSKLPNIIWGISSHFHSFWSENCSPLSLVSAVVTICVSSRHESDWAWEAVNTVLHMVRVRGHLMMSKYHREVKMKDGARSERISVQWTGQRKTTDHFWTHNIWCLRILITDTLIWSRAVIICQSFVTRYQGTLYTLNCGSFPWWD